MLNSLLLNLKSLLITGTISSSCIYGYCHYKANKNEKQYLQAIKSDTLKDASRLTNDSFGISWGFQADDTVMNGIDSGDLFFIKYECIQCLDPLQMLKCFKLTLPLLEQEYHAVGVAYRDQSGLICYFNQFGQKKFMRYSQFVSLPYIKELMVQKTSLNIHQKLIKLLQEDKAFDQILDQSGKLHIQSQIQTSSINITNFQQNIKQIFVPKQNTFDFINRVLKRINIIEDDQIVTDIRELLRSQKQINIRTQTNKTLRSL